MVALLEKIWNSAYTLLVSKINLVGQAGYSIKVHELCQANSSPVTSGFGLGANVKV